MPTKNTDLLDIARSLLKGKWGLAIGTFLVYGLIISAVGSIPKAGGIISLLAGGPFALGAAMFSLSIARGEEARLEQIFSGFNYFSKALAAYLLMVLYIILWSILLIVPGIIAALSYSMTFYVLADDLSLTPSQALDKSKAMMNGYKMKLFGLGMLFFLLALLCVLTLGIGFLWFIPFANVTMARFYDDIRTDK